MRTLSFVALALSSALALPAHAQFTSYPAVQPTTPADQLAAVMRRLAAAPNDLQALISAGELSVKLDDMSAAAAFFARADKLDGRNGRVKAGMASILVRAERPGEALRFYQLAESYGLDPSRYAADRGLAYDLVGEQERAQRDYRLALRAARDDETVRRYALSLGISGKLDAAQAELDPLVRRGDRAAWRVRTFVLAMNGDVEGARRIATTMMPAGMAAGLQPFFQRLPSLPAVDRAFAVHFGEVRPTPARLADARMKPVLPALGPDPYAPVQVAARPPAPAAAQPARDDRRTRRDRVQLASRRTPSRVVPASSIPGSSAALAPRQAPPPVATQPPAQVAARPAAPTVPASVAQATRPVQTGLLAATQPAPPATRPTQTFPTQTYATQPVVNAPALASPAPQPVANASALASSTSLPSPTQTPIAAPTLAAAQSVPAAPVVRPAINQPVAPATTLATVQPAAAPAAATVQPATTSLTQLASVAPTSLPRPLTSSPASSVVPAPARPSDGIAQPPIATASTSVAPAVSTGSNAPLVDPSAPATAVASLPTPQPAQPVAAVATATPTEVAGAAPAPGFSSVAPPPVALASAPPAAPTPAVRSEDSILARIVASITIPGEELGIVSPDRPAPVPALVADDRAAARTLAAGTVKAAEERADRAAAAKTIAAVTRSKPVEATKTGSKTEEAKPATRTRSGKVELASKGADRTKPGVKTDQDGKPKTAAEKRGADRKAAEEKAAADKKGVSKTAAKEKPDAPRIWVQVAGGASENDLSKAWTAAQKKAAALKGRDAYTTPLRATNRVVTGPFKTEAEAQAFVNQLARQGVSAFQFTSANGQKMTKLSAK